MNFGTMDEAEKPEDVKYHKPAPQPDGYSLDEIAGQLSGENDDPLTEFVEELADTATIEQLLDTFIGKVDEMFNDILEVSLEGNPVRTHLELGNVVTEVVDLAFELRQELIAKVANRAEQIEEQGGQLRKQVIPEGD